MKYHTEKSQMKQLGEDEVQVEGAGEHGITISLWEFNVVNGVMMRELANEVRVVSEYDEQFLRNALERAVETEGTAMHAEVEIYFNDGFIMYFGFNNPNYAFILNPDERVSKNVYMPEGLVEFVRGKLSLIE